MKTAGKHTSRNQVEIADLKMKSSLYKTASNNRVVLDQSSTPHQSRKSHNFTITKGNTQTIGFGIGSNRGLMVSESKGAQTLRKNRSAERINSTVQIQTANQG